jgi:peptidyl-prolyl cis-trans isomerase A (cyclophilin A)/peptidyl-prolyl cis-trans isomerase B (cyclophilin B)
MKIRILFICILLTTAQVLHAQNPINPSVVLETNYGNIVIELFYDKAPKTVDNFLGYVNSGFYDYLLFHRIVQSGIFVIQGGAYYYYNNSIYFWTPDQPNIINESYNGLSNLRGTIAMARASDPNSANSQFYINTADDVMLDKANAADHYGYCVFGRVTEGMNVVDAIAAVPTFYYNSQLPELPNPLVGIYTAYVRPCDSPDCSNYNSDDKLNFQDFRYFASEWMQQDCNSLNAFCGHKDLDYSGTCDIHDLAIFARNWLNL